MASSIVGEGDDDMKLALIEVVEAMRERVSEPARALQAIRRDMGLSIPGRRWERER